jgi:hypothetical protein
MMTRLPNGRARQLAGRLLTPRLRATGRAAAESLGVSTATIDRLRSSLRQADGPTLINVSRVTPAAPAPSRLLGAEIQSPQTGTRVSTYTLDIVGWVAGNDAPVEMVELLHGKTVLLRTPVQEARPEIAKRLELADDARPIGFRLTAGMIGLPLDVDLSLQSVFADEPPSPIGTIHIQRQPLRSGYTPALHPLMVTSPGRAGTTWTMRLLSEHPGIVAMREYPYEFRAGRYWLHLLETLSKPADPIDSVTTSSFFLGRTHVGQHPFFPIYRPDATPINAWAGRAYVEHLAAFCQQSIDGCYLEVAAMQGQENPVYFAEKHVPDRFPVVGHEIDPRARELFLIRDYRDILSSIVAFNQRRGYFGFGRDNYATDEDYLRQHLAKSLRRFRRSWEERSHQSLLLRYEDLITHPVETLRAVFTYLDLNAKDATIESILHRAAQDTSQLHQHQTSESPAASIGRWRRDLDPNLQAVCTEVLGEHLVAFGYDV